jgi:hypothetical protein
VRGFLATAAAITVALAVSPAAQAQSIGVDAAAKRADAPSRQLEPAARATLPGGAVVTRFEQEVGGIPVVGAGAVVLEVTGEPASLIFDTTDSRVPDPRPPALSRSAATRIALAEAGVERLGGAPSARLVLTGGGELLAWEALLPSDEPYGDFLVSLDASTGEIVSSVDILRRAMGRARLYEPNPVVENDGYGGVRDRRDRNSRRLTRLRSSVRLENLDDGQDCLRGAWARVRFSSRARPVCKASLNWNQVRRNRGRFEALMSYFHVNDAQEHIQALDLPEPANAEPQRVFANAFGDDNSFYSPGRDDIALGRGGVDDAEDADVIVHEYGHAVQDAQNPEAFRTSNFQTGAQGEGFGDYLAAAYSTETAGSHPEWTPCIMEWDATSYDRDTPGSPGICLRRADNPRNARQQRQRCGGGSNIHCVGEVWSSALLELRNDLGDDLDGDSVMDTVVLASHELLPPSPSFQQASRALLEADQAIYAGIHCLAIEDELESRRLFEGGGCL